MTEQEKGSTNIPFIRLNKDGRPPKGVHFVQNIPCDKLTEELQKINEGMLERDRSWFEEYGDRYVIGEASDRDPNKRGLYFDARPKRPKQEK